MKRLIGLALCALPLVADAGGIDRLKAFAASTASAEAVFTQTVADKQGRVTQRASGTMAFARPGKFRWDYAAPYEQVIVGDGSKLWLYDADLNQVTVRKLGDALSGTPAALLAGDKSIEKLFKLKDAGSSGGLEWLDATPKSQDTSFDHIRMGFAGDALAQMDLYDRFGQHTTLKFTQFKRNPALGAARFRFSPPKGADVIGD